MNREIVIDLGAYVESTIKSRISCVCTATFDGTPNTHYCPVCVGVPGTLSMLNREVVRYAVRVVLALGCTIIQYSRFDRKGYLYPDLPKVYQISQLYLPIGRDGAMEAGNCAVGIHGLHMEGGTDKPIHNPWMERIKVDYNHCGVPLIGIVTEPGSRAVKGMVTYLE